MPGIFLAAKASNGVARFGDSVSSLELQLQSIWAEVENLKYRQWQRYISTEIRFTFCDQEAIMHCRLVGTLKQRISILFIALSIGLAQPSLAASIPPKEDQPAIPVGVATHRQANQIQVVDSGDKQAKVACFCLTTDDKILAGCAGQQGEIRVIDAEGKLADKWSLPVNPEAIFSRPDGAIFVAGEGQLLRLSSTGKVESSVQGPQTKALEQNPEKLREEIITQAKQQAQQLAKQTEVYDKMTERADKEIAKIDDQIASLDDSSKGESKESGNESRKPRNGRSSKEMLEQRRMMYSRQKDQYEQMKKQFAEMMGGSNTGELTDAQIDERVKASKAYKQKASSISAMDGDVFLATHATFGYGFEVWRMDDKFENPSVIVKELSGCCGQMDVKANKEGLFVAENSKHRVCHFDRDGKSIANWGQGARTGLEGFGSCCNPMNVAFGPADAIYTAEDDTGRIKRYSADGKLLGLVGSVELKPGCKNCSISVSKDGSHVYMLDITRNCIVRLDARAADEITADAEKAKNAPPDAQPEKKSAGASFFDGLKTILSGN